MDQSTAKYIVTYYSHLLTGRESMAMKYSVSLIGAGADVKDGNPNLLTNVYKERGWGIQDNQVRNMLIDGYDAFEIKVATRILKDHKDKIVLNNCPRCEKLAKTPSAKKCGHCGHEWH